MVWTSPVPTIRADNMPWPTKTATAKNMAATWRNFQMSTPVPSLDAAAIVTASPDQTVRRRCSVSSLVLPRVISSSPSSPPSARGRIRASARWHSRALIGRAHAL